MMRQRFVEFVCLLLDRVPRPSVLLSAATGETQATCAGALESEVTPGAAYRLIGHFRAYGHDVGRFRDGRQEAITEDLACPLTLAAWVGREPRWKGYEVPRG